MSHWQPPPPHEFRPYEFPPHEEFDETRRSSRSRLWLTVLFLVGALGFCGILCCGFFGYILYYDLGQGGQAQVSPFPRDDQPVEEKCREVAVAFDAELDLPTNQREMHAYRRLFDKLVEATQTDAAAFARLVDTNRHFREFQQSSHAPSLNYFEKIQVEFSIEEGLEIPAVWDRYEITHVQPSDDGRESLVYAYLWSGEECWEMRFWLVRDGGRWKLYDWEFLEDGYRSTSDWAIQIAHDDDPWSDNHIVVMDDVSESYASDDLEETRQIIRRAERRRILPEFQDFAHSRIAMAWYRTGEYELAITTAEKMLDPDRCPCGYYVLAESHLALENYQQALDWAAKYEQFAGRGPRSLKIRSASYVALGQLDQAIDAWRQLVEIDPENEDALVSFALWADKEAKNNLIASTLARCSDPLDMAASLAERFWVYDEVEGTRAVADALREKEKSSPLLHVVEGHAHAIEEQWQDAADAYLKAVLSEPDNEVRESYSEHYFTAMHRAGKTIEAYHQAPDAENAFYLLTDLYDDEYTGFTDELLRQLIAEHRKKVPQDPWLLFYTGKLLNNEEKYAEAVDFFNKELASTSDEETLDLVGPIRAQAHVGAELVLEAYDAQGASEESFLQLARLCYWREKWKSLKQLNERHRVNFPNDPWLGFYQGRVCVHEEDYVGAEGAYSRAFRAVDESDEETRDAIRSAWIDARIATHDSILAYRELGPPEEVFPYIGRALILKQRWGQWEELVSLHRSQFPDSSECIRMQVQAAWQRGRYQQVIRLLAPFDIARRSEWDANTVGVLQEWLVRSYLRMGETEQAKTFAQSVYDEQGKLYLLALVHLKLGQYPRAIEILKKQRTAASDLYEDEDVGALARSPELLALRQAVPPPLPRPDAIRIVMFLAQDAQPMTEQAVNVLVEQAGIEARVVTLPGEGEPDARVTRVIQFGDRSVYFTWGEKPIFSPDEIEDLEIESDALRTRVAESGAWLEIGGVAEKESQVAELVRFAAALANEDCTAIYLSSDSRLLENSQPLRETLTSGNAVKQIESQGEKVWLPLPSNYKYYLGNLRLIRQFGLFFSRRGPEQEVAVQVALPVGGALERQWLTVDDVEFGANGISRVTATFRESPLLLPHLKPGEPANFHQYRILAWRHSDGDGWKVYSTIQQGS